MRNSGFFQDLRLQELEAVLSGSSDVEVVVLHSLGTYLACDDAIALIRAPSDGAAEKIVPHLQSAVVLESEREINSDPAWGIIELESIAWTTVSSAKSTPEPPRLVINVLRDIFTRWVKEEGSRTRGKETLPVVYPDDVQAHVLNALATIAAGANESLQHVVMIEALRALQSLYGSVPPDVKPAIKDVIRRLVPALRPLILTKELECAIRALARCLQESGDEHTAKELTDAVEELATLIGRLPTRAAAQES